VGDRISEYVPVATLHTIRHKMRSGVLNSYGRFLMDRNFANLRRNDNSERAYTMLGYYQICFRFCSPVRYTKNITCLYMPDIFSASCYANGHENT
jgi:hypothetical protein